MIYSKKRLTTMVVGAAMMAMAVSL